MFVEIQKNNWINPRLVTDFCYSKELNGTRWKLMAGFAAAGADGQQVFLTFYFETEESAVEASKKLLDAR